MVTRGVGVKWICTNEGIEPKVLAAKTEIHESTISRFFNGHKDISDEQFFQVGIVIGEMRAERRARSAR